MPSTLPVDFDHHSHGNGRSAFAQWASELGFTYISPEPVFKYGCSFDDGIACLRSLSTLQNCLYLCNVVGHASAVTTGTAFDTKASLAFSYSDIESLISKPNVIGHFISDSLLPDALSPLQGWFVICGERFFCDMPPDAGLETIKFVPSSDSSAYRDGVYICRLIDHRKCAKHFICTDFPTYFIHPTAKLDFSLIADRYRRFKLCQYLLRSNVVFGTLGDCHTDDCIAVSYRSIVFDFPETARFFIR